MTLGKQVGVPRNKKVDMEVTPSAFTNIWPIDTKFLRDEEDGVRKKTTKKMSIVDVEALELGTVDLGIEAGITSSSHNLHSSSSLLHPQRHRA